MPLTAAEQYFLELQNRARLDPLSEASRLGIDLNQGLAAGTLDGNARAVLASNDFLNASAETHSEWMLAADTFSHTGSGGSNPGQRMTASGYAFTGAWTWGENIAWSGTSGAVNLEAAIAGHHAGLFRSSGHRLNTLNDAFREIGVGQSGGQYTVNGTAWNASMLTSVFARSGGNVFVTGVAFADLNGDSLYSIGEGRAGVTFQVYGGSSVQNGAAGGYSVATVAAVETMVQILHGGFVTEILVDTSAGNAKIDLVGDRTLATSVDVALGTGAVTDLRLLGVSDLAATGNLAANELTGNSGANSLDGAAGADSLYGEVGNDTLVGGAGADLMDGGAGTRDLVSYWTAATGLRAVLIAPVGNTGDAAGDTYAGVEDLGGSGFNDVLGGDNAANQILAGNGNDDMDGLAGADSLYGGSGNDRLIGGAGGDVLDGGAGTYDGASYWNSAGLRADMAFAATNTGDAIGDSYVGIENLQGSGFADILGGDNLANTLGGLAGNDALAGRGGNDTLGGEAGNDTLIGEAGNDVLVGGAGADVFVFNVAPSATNRDSVLDYVVADDTIWLENAVMTGLAAGALGAAAFVSGPAATALAHRVIYNGANGQLLYDADGTGAAPATLIATLTAGLVMTAGEFVVI